MQVSQHVHALRVPFNWESKPGKIVERFVYAYLIYGKQIYLIDAGASGSKDVIFYYIKGTGRSPDEIAMIVFTHCHPDHVGGAPGIQRATGCKTAAHVDDTPWIEDVELQYRERPVAGFLSLVEGSTKVDVRLKEGNNIQLGNGDSLSVIHTPGHSKGHISLLHDGEGVLISGDSVPLVAGKAPVIYDDPIASIKSIRKQRELKGLSVLLSSWDEPRYGDRIYQIMGEGIGYIQDIHKEVLKAKALLGSSDTTSIGKEVGRRLGLPETALSLLFFRAIESNLKIIDSTDISGV